MPRGVYNRKPAEGAAVGGGEIPAEVRGPIRDMLAPGSDKDFTESLPDQTSNDGAAPEAPTRRKRRTKAEIEAEKGPSAPVDRRLERAKGKAAGLGAASLIKTGFEAAKKPLTSEESEDVDDQFYLIANKAGIDPTGSWLFLALYTVALLARLILSRTDLGEQIREFIAGIGKKEEEINQQGTTEKA